MSDVASSSLAVPNLGYCARCGCRVSDSFRDEATRREYLISRFCEQCSDALARPVARGDAPRRGRPVLHGLVAAVVCDAFAPSECAIIPFRADPHTGGVEWVPEHVVRAGRPLPHLEPFGELAALSERWAEGHVRVLAVASLFDPLLCRRLVRSHVVVALDRGGVAAVERLCPSAALPAVLDLSVEVPWPNAYGVSIVPPDPFLRLYALDAELGSAAAWHASALRQAALVARLFELRAPVGPHAGDAAADFLLRRCVRGGAAPSRAFADPPVPD